MKYTVHIDISLPRDRVIELFDNPDHLRSWKPDLISFKHRSGEPGEVGATSEIYYKMGKKKVEMIETIVERRLPDAISATYEAGRVWNKVDNHFSEVGPNRTRWTLDSEFRLKGIMKVVAKLMPGMFKKQSLTHMERFKAFAEQA